uniref:Uncharacterized protein n=1 Tax=Eutreptiella gymnastica TaxID=73025 RepID=A0A7S1J3M8_9EUGL
MASSSHRGPHDSKPSSAPTDRMQKTKSAFKREFGTGRPVITYKLWPGGHSLENSHIFGGNVGPARSGPVKGSNLPLEARQLPRLATIVVKVPSPDKDGAQTGKSWCAQPTFSPCSNRMRAGQTFVL